MFVNFSILTTCNLLVQLISIISSIRVARLLEPSGYGVFNLFFVHVTLFSIVGLFGLRLVLIKSIARNESLSGKLFKHSLEIRLFTTLIAIGICFFYNLLFSKANYSQIVFVLLIFQILITVFFDSVDAISYGHQVMKTSAYLNLIFVVFWVISIYILPVQFFTIQSLLVIQTFYLLIKTIIYYLIIRTSNFLIVVFDENEVNHKWMIQQGAPFFILAIFTAITNQIPVLMLELNSSMDQLGIFNLGYRILMPLQLVINTSFTALFPNLAAIALKDKEQFYRNVKKAIILITVIGSLGCISFCVFSNDVVRLLYGKKYADSAIMIAIQCWYTLLFGIFSLIGTVLSSTDKQHLLSRLSIAYAVFSVPCFWYGTKYGAIGLSYAFLAGSLINMTYHWHFFRKIMDGRLTLKFSIILWISLIGVIAISILLVPYLNSISRLIFLATSFFISYFTLVRSKIFTTSLKKFE